MKILGPVLAVPAAVLVSWNMTTVVLALVMAFVVLIVFCYLLITRPEVAPDIDLSRRGLKLRFRRLPSRLGGRRRPGDDQA
jgi:hypothetical protein